MTIPAFYSLLGTCGALALLSGCVQVRQSPVPQAPPAAVPVTNAPAAEAAAPVAPPEGFSWDALARLAAANSAEAAALLTDADAERHQTAADTGWRNPRLTAGHHWGDEDENTRSSSGDSAWSDRSFSGETLGLRVYTSNPFVNRWLRKRGAANAQAKEAESKETAYAVYCEVKSLCLEADSVRSEIDLLQQMLALREEALNFRRKQSEAGVVNALETIKSEARLATLNAEVCERRIARDQLVRRIGALCGLSPDRIRIRPGDAEIQIRPDVLSAAALTDLAFLRRPDLIRTLREKDAAAYAVQAARAGQIPWFEYVEVQVESETADDSSYDSSNSFDSSSRDEHEWQLRTALTLPIFNWLGDEIRLSRVRLAAAETRAQGLYDQIRREIDGLLQTYLATAAACDHVTGEFRRIQADLSSRVDALEKEPAVGFEDVLAVRETLLEYKRTCMKTARESRRLTLYLETVSGGPLTPAP